jgi:hypothetical protein
MTSIRQIDAARRNALKSTGPRTEAGKQASRCNAVRHGLTAETVIGALEDAADYRAFEASITADYDAQSAVERELVLRLASLLWRLRRAAAIETGLFEIQAVQLDQLGEGDRLSEGDRLLEAILAVHSPVDGHCGRALEFVAATNTTSALARCFLRLANLPNFALDRLSRYEASLWRQVAQTLFALDDLDRRKPQERRRLAFRRETSTY